jgi:parallel beta-helix repeat protein
MKRTYLLCSITIAALMIVMSFSVLSSMDSTIEQPQKAIISAYTPHGPISINGNTEFAEQALAESWPGNGMVGSPYIIQGYDMNAISEHGILIQNTSLYFIIRDCSVRNGGTSHEGIYLVNCTHGTLTRNTCSNYYAGIYLDSSGNISITHNICSDNIEDIGLFESNNNIVSDNNCSNDYEGIRLIGSSSNIVRDNNCSNDTNFGISMENSGGNTVTNNTCDSNTYYGILIIVDSDGNTINGNTCNWNEYHGIFISLSYTNTLNGNTCSNNTRDGINNYKSSYTFVFNNTCSDNGWSGISADQSSNLNVDSNVLIGNGQGILLVNTSSAELMNNEMIGYTVWDEFGIYILDSSGCTVIENSIWDCWNVGIILGNASYSNVYHNNLFNNYYQAMDTQGTGNTFDDGYPSGGNYWSDYTGSDVFSGAAQDVPGADGIGDVSYHLAYYEYYPAQDDYPLMEPYGIVLPIPPECTITSPTNASTYFTNWGRIKLIGTASDDVGVTSITWSNSLGGIGTAYGTTSWQSRGNIQLFTGANVITVSAHDADGNTGTDVLTVTYEKVSPTVTINSPTSNPTHVTNSATIALSGFATDASGISSVTWRNVATGASGAASNKTIWSITGISLNLGMNLIYVNATDNAGNKGSDAIWVTYSIDTLVVTITSPTSNPTMTTGWHYIKLIGTASDDVKVTLVVWNNTLTGQTGITYMTPQWGGASVSWQSRGQIHLLPGVNEITVTAYDNAGNSKTDILTVTYTGL